MKKLFKTVWIFMSTLILFAVCGCGGVSEDKSANSTSGADGMDNSSVKTEDSVGEEIDFHGAVAAENIKAVRASAWKKYLEIVRADEKRKDEVASLEMLFGSATMRYEYFVIGEPGENGYPLFIAMHGGGQSDTPDMNDQQWEHMKVMYQNC